MDSKMWIKVYTKILENPKVGQLDDKTWRIMMELFLVAGETFDDGRLPDIKTIAWKLRRTTNEIKSALQKLEEIGTVTLTDDYVLISKEFFDDIPELIRNSTDYSRWRKSVFIRDEYKCQYCGQAGGKLNAHHIKRFVDYPAGRLDLDNGITLCESCHRKLHRHEIELGE